MEAPPQRPLGPEWAAAAQEQPLVAPALPPARFLHLPGAAHVDLVRWLPAPGDGGGPARAHLAHFVRQLDSSRLPAYLVLGLDGDLFALDWQIPLRALLDGPDRLSVSEPSYPLPVALVRRGLADAGITPSEAYRGTHAALGGHFLDLAFTAVLVRGGLVGPSARLFPLPEAGALAAFSPEGWRALGTAPDRSAWCINLLSTWVTTALALSQWGTMRQLVQRVVHYGLRAPGDPLAAAAPRRGPRGGGERSPIMGPRATSPDAASDS